MPKPALYFSFRSFTGFAFTGLFLLTTIGLFSSCEDDPILNIQNEEACSASYCLLVEPSPFNIPLELKENPEEF